MRSYTGGVAHVAEIIESDLSDRDTLLQKPHVSALSDLASCALSCRSSNTAEWASVLPRKVGDQKSKERFISRALSNTLIDPLDVMEGFIPELSDMQSSQGCTIILMLDQSKISDGFECLMLSMRTGERAIPVAWKVIETKGGIGFDVQETLLESAFKMLPEGCDVLLAGDRFYGTSALIEWCQRHGWHYRIRLKSNLKLFHEGGEITTGDAANQKVTALENAVLANQGTTTHIGILHEKGHREPWIIAMDSKPNKYKVLDYGMRWGIECLFSDFKSRGFCITKTHLNHADRIEKLILILTIALFWAVSTGMQPQPTRVNRTKKNS